ncbi:MAG: NAD(P)-binding protein [Microcella sp.]|uniref:NAD(P)/FAD-dependent oxidoreductase n=1 Tax=Microcella sp. TaxID=1913979 RepID=UPI0024C98008|nr:NAD(P)/FAD-dependent oxidoreductase [Microcella sp.]UYN83091.1 MAG: NAD(P)-binding protein [Microcella sp.]
MNEVIVVGSGLAGLVAARQNVLQGRTVRVLDTASRAGASALSAQIAGVTLDVGTLYLDPFDTALADVVDRSGQSPGLVPSEPKRWWLATPTGTLPLPEMHVVGVPAAPLAAETIAIVGRRAAWRGMLDAVMPGPRGSKASTLGELVRARLGVGITDSLVAPVVRALTGSALDELSPTDIDGLRHLMLQQNSLTRAVTQLRLDDAGHHRLTAIAGGPSTLVTALLAELDTYGVPIELGVDRESLDMVRDDADSVIETHDRPRGAIATLVLDGSQVPAGRRGAGVLAGHSTGAPVRRVLDLSSLWPSLYGQDPSLTLLRVESDSELTVDEAIEIVARWWDSAGVNAAVKGAYLMRDDDVNP